MMAGVGVDVISISRVKRAAERCGERFLRRVFTEREIERCLKSGDAYAQLAGRFAAKEAVFKALGHVDRGRLRWRDIEIEDGGPGGVEVVMSEALRRLFDERGARGVLLSLSHDRTSDVAVAVAVLVR